MTRNRSAFLPAVVLVLWCAAPERQVWGQSATQPATDSAGLGTAEVLPTISWKDAPRYLNKEVFLVGKVVHADRIKAGHVFLDFDAERKKGCTIFIRKENVTHFADPPEKTYADKMIKVRGFVSEYRGQTEIALAQPDHISILPDQTPLPASASLPAMAATRSAIGDTITLASYNLLNLFDSADDPYTADETTAPKPKKELEALGKSIRALNADVLAVVEVENRGVLQQFVDAHLSDMGYEVVLFEGNDTRGIDVGLLSRLPVGAVTSHRHLHFNDLNGHPTRFQRDLLEVQLLPAEGQPFEVFVVHLKSKNGDNDGGLEIRQPEARVARTVIDDLLKAHPDERFVICGDFNDELASQPVQTIIGTGERKLTEFVDDLPANNRVTYNQPPYLSMIDFILASPAMARQYVPHSYNVIPGSPETTGSDHNPVLAKFKVR